MKPVKLTKAQREALEMASRSSMVQIHLGTAKALVRMGLIERTNVTTMSTVGGSLYFVTDAGRVALKAAGAK